VYGKHEAIQQTFIYGDSLQSTLVAIIVPNESFPQWCKERGFEGTLEELAKNDTVRKTFSKEMSDFGKKNGLKGFEVFKNVYFELVPFSPENGLLSPTFKSKRHELYNVYKEEIKRLYGELA
jgi:long-chain acyl-CoA synthetase